MTTENLTTLEIHKLEKGQYEKLETLGKLVQNALYLTPEEPIDLDPYLTEEEAAAIYATQKDLTDMSHIYANGTLVNLNGTSYSKKTASFFAPVANGDKGNFLQSNGENEAPSWIDAQTARGNLGFSGAVTSIISEDLKQDRVLVSSDSGKVIVSDMPVDTLMGLESKITGAVGTLEASIAGIKSGIEADISTKISALDDKKEDKINILPITKGGTGASSASEALTQLGAIAITQVGSKGGVAPLNANGKISDTYLPSYVPLESNGLISSNYLPSYVDDVLEFANKTNFPATGEPGKIYVDTTNKLTYRWSGSEYVEISKSLALGESSTTAYRGDLGKIAYNHSQSLHTVPMGGTGAITFTSGEVLIGNGTGAIQTRAITNNTSAAAVSASTNLITANTLYYHKGNSNITTVGTITSGTWKGTPVGIGYGGTGAVSLTANRLLFSNGSAFTSSNHCVDSTRMTINGALREGISLYVNGNTALGNANTDTTTVQGSFIQKNGHIYLDGAATASISNTTQIVFRQGTVEHIALSSNDDCFVINPSSSSSSKQIALYLGEKSTNLSTIPSKLSAAGFSTSGAISGGSLSISGAATVKTLTISETAGTGHLSFSRSDGPNYVKAPYNIGFHVGTDLKLENCSLVIASNYISPGVTGGSSLGTESNIWKQAFVEQLQVKGNITLPVVGKSYSETTKEASSAAISFTTTLSTNNYHPMIGVKTNGGHNVHYAGLKDNIGFYGFTASNTTTNTPNWTFLLDAATGNLTTTSDIKTSQNLTTSKLHVTNYTDADLTDSEAAFVIGPKDGEHIEIDSNEIMAKTNATTAGTLYLQNEGGTVSINGITKITNSTASTTTTDGALVVTGGVGIGKALYVGANIQSAGSIFVKSATAETQMGVNGPAGQLYLFSQSTATGNRGLYGKSAGGTASTILLVGSDNTATFYGSLSGNANSATLLKPTESGATGAKGTWQGSIPTTGKVIWREAFKHNGLNNDSGDIVFWMANQGTTEATLNVLIDGCFYQRGQTGFYKVLDEKMIITNYGEGNPPTSAEVGQVYFKII